MIIKNLYIVILLVIANSCNSSSNEELFYGTWHGENGTSFVFSKGDKMKIIDKPENNDRSKITIGVYRIKADTLFLAVSFDRVMNPVIYDFRSNDTLALTGTVWSKKTEFFIKDK